MTQLKSSANFLESIECSIIEEIKLSTGSEFCAKIHVVKHNKELKSGDFFVLMPKAKSQYSSSDGNEDSEKHSNDINASKLHSDFSKYIQKVDKVENAKFAIYLNRALIYKMVISDALKQGTNFGSCDAYKDQVSILNCSLLANQDIANAVRSDELTLHQLRLFLLSCHVQSLLKANGLVLKCPKYFASEEVNSYLRKNYDCEFVNSSRLSEQSDISHEQHRIACEDWLSKSVCDIKNGRSCNEFIKLNDSELVFDLRNFLSQSNLAANYSKNLKVYKLHGESLHISPLFHLENTITEELISANSTPRVFCVHTALCDQEFSQQQLDVVWQIINPCVATNIYQLHVLGGRVTSRQGTDSITLASDFFSLRHQQMKDAFRMKYGNSMPEESWENTILDLVKAAIKFELLSTIGRHEVKLDMAPGNVDNKAGVFVMYNCARLATLFRHFEESVAAGICTQLPSVEEVDLLTLRQEEEWDLLYNYVLPYPNLVHETVAGIDRHQVVLTHKICQFLTSLSNSLSCYYSKTHILCEPRAHLMSIVHARLYLLKAVQQVMHNALDLLSIRPCSQL